MTDETIFSRIGSPALRAENVKSLDELCEQYIIESPGKYDAKHEGGLTIFGDYSLTALALANSYLENYLKENPKLKPFDASKEFLEKYGERSFELFVGLYFAVIHATEDPESPGENVPINISVDESKRIITAMENYLKFYKKRQGK